MFEEFEKKANTKNGTIWIFITSSILLTLFLFYIDEGNYNFNWAENYFSLIMVLIYAAPMFLAQWLFYKFLPKNLSKTEKYLFSIPIGLIVGVVLVISIFKVLA
ncbi:MAG: hypothetical protein KDD16_11365 [Mangrovimonas sp.]|nr:hypothetical protein [Mangrovimonas sp.]